MLPQTFFRRSLKKRPSFHTLSKALVRSTKTASVFIFCWKPFLISWVSSVTWSSVFLFFLKPDCEGERRPFCSRWCWRCLFTMRSMVLPRQLRRLMGQQLVLLCLSFPFFEDWDDYGLFPAGWKCPCVQALVVHVQQLLFSHTSKMADHLIGNAILPWGFLVF